MMLLITFECSVHVSDVFLKTDWIRGCVSGVSSIQFIFYFFELYKAPKYGLRVSSRTSRKVEDEDWRRVA